jgi:hypothetical protein
LEYFDLLSFSMSFFSFSKQIFFSNEVQPLNAREVQNVRSPHEVEGEKKKKVKEKEEEGSRLAECRRTRLSVPSNPILGGRNHVDGATAPSPLP